MHVSYAVMSLAVRGLTVATFARVHWPRGVIYAGTSPFSYLSSAVSTTSATTTFAIFILFGLVVNTYAIL